MSKYSNHIAPRKHPILAAIVTLLLVVAYGLSLIVKDKRLSVLLARIGEGSVLVVIALGLWFIFRHK